MPVETIQMVEERCDRCRLLLVTKRTRKDGEVLSARRHAEQTGKFEVLENGKKVVAYEMICAHCLSHLRTILKKMGPVDRTKGGKQKDPGSPAKKITRNHRRRRVVR